MENKDLKFMIDEYIDFMDTRKLLRTLMERFYINE